MILNLEKLRKDSKIYRKKDDEIFMRINILLEYSKIEMKYSGDINKNSKALYLTAFLKSMEFTENNLLYQIREGIYFLLFDLSLGKMVEKEKQLHTPEFLLMIKNKI